MLGPQDGRHPDAGTAAESIPRRRARSLPGDDRDTADRLLLSHEGSGHVPVASREPGGSHGERIEHARDDSCIRRGSLQRASVLIRRGLILTLLLSMSAIVSAPRAVGEPAGAGVPKDWLGAVQQDIAESEYEVTWQSATVFSDLPAAWQAPNRAQDSGRTSRSAESG